jgi:hypothetical protein
MEQGLIPRSITRAKGIKVIFNDSDRIDGCPNANCLSIGFPNYKMFWACRQSYKDVRWVVLVVDLRVLWEKDCAFCQENAASNAVTCIPLTDRKGINAFNRLYDEIDGKPSRKDLGIPDRAPTNPQAEVLIFDIIKPELILGVVVEDQFMEKEVKRLCPEVDTEIHAGFFSARKDYEYWK